MLAPTLPALARPQRPQLGAAQTLRVATLQRIMALGIVHIHGRLPTVAARAASTPNPHPDAATVAAADAAAAKYGWDVHRSPPPLTPTGVTRGPRIVDVPPTTIRRPLGRSRTNDAAKVVALAASIAVCGQIDPVDVLEHGGELWGFSGCHRMEAVRDVLQLPTIRCRVRRVTRSVLMMHLR